MSRSNPTISSPVRRHFKWAASEGNLVWWDKDRKEEVVVALPYRFIVLDQLSTITGYSKPHETGIWANEVRDTKNDVLVVRMKKMVLEQGLYPDIKDKVKSQGAKYTASVYIAYQEAPDSPWVIGNVKFAGASVTPWFELRKTLGVPLDSAGIGITITDTKYIEASKTIKYYEPKFEMFATSDEDEAAVKELDQKLQTYLEIRLAQRDDERDERAEIADPMGHGPLPEAGDDDPLDKPIDLSEIPF